jgi:superkiller protein 3
MKGSLFLALMMAASCLAQTAETYRRDATEFARQKSWDQAIASYRKALEVEPNDALTHYDLALALKYKGEAQQAVGEFKSALRLKSKWADAQYGLGAALYDLHDLPAAAKEVQTAIRLAPANAAAHRLLARIYLEQSNPSSAKTELQHAIALKPSAELYTELGLTEGQLANLPAAAAAFRRALQLNPRFTTAYTLLGVTLRRQGDHAAALAEFRKAVAVEIGRASCRERVLTGV